MPLPKPELDSRTFDQLVEEGRALIPRYAPGWTDHNASDPGITLLELFAYLAEQDFYRLDRTTPEAYRAFLRLAGVAPRPAQVAETVLVLRQEAAGAPVPLPEGIQVGDTSGSTSFETADQVTISPARIARVFAGSESAPQDVTAANARPGVLFPPFGAEAKPGGSLVLAFDRPLTSAAVPISFYVWTADPARDRDARAALIAEWKARQADGKRDCPAGISPDNPDWRLHYAVRTAWEYRTSDGSWSPLADVVDETRALTLSGFVRFTAPADMAAGGPHPALFCIRCRIVSGPFECAPLIDAVALNAVAALHAARIESEETLGASAGHAAETYTTARFPIVPGSVSARVLVGGMPDGTWEEQATFDLSGPHDRHFTLNPEEGVLAFGDGRQGRVPPAEAEIRATYRVGGGSVGNVPAATLSRLLLNTQNVALVPGWPAIAPSLSVEQPYPALGGAPTEDLVDAEARAYDSLSQATRAVTLADFETLALRTPGVPVARVKALTDYHPAFPCWPAPGSVTVIFIPDCDTPAPMPGEEFLRAVARWLDPRRIVTGELHVIPPCYTPVAVSATLTVEPGEDGTGVRAQALAALAAFFDPLHGGPDGGGWPIGRDVYRAEVMALLAGIPGVVSVTNLGLGMEGDSEPRCDNVTICPDCLPASGSHTVTVLANPAVPVIERNPQDECREQP